MEKPFWELANVGSVAVGFLSATPSWDVSGAVVEDRCRFSGAM